MIKPHNERDKSMSDSNAIIHVKDLQYSWRKNGPSIINIAALDIMRAERVFIKGASGSGKTTLLSILGGVVSPQNGEVVVLDQSINRLNSASRDHFRAEHIGFLFQMFNLIPYLSVVENVSLPCRFAKQRNTRAKQRSETLEDEALRLLAHLDLTDKALLSRPVTELSVGQQQRVAAARALIGSPEIIIADEPTSSLDADRRSAFIKLLMQECEDMAITLVFVSHDAALEQYFDRSIDLHQLNRAGKH